MVHRYGKKKIEEVRRPPFPIPSINIKPIKVIPMRPVIASPVSRSISTPSFTASRRSLRIFFRFLLESSDRKASKESYPGFCQWYCLCVLLSHPSSEPRPSVLVKGTPNIDDQQLLSSPSERSLGFKIERKRRPVAGVKGMALGAWIISTARSFKRIGPAVVKDILALGVTFR